MPPFALIKSSVHFTPIDLSCSAVLSEKCRSWIGTFGILACQSNLALFCLFFFCQPFTLRFRPVTILVVSFWRHRGKFASLLSDEIARQRTPLIFGSNASRPNRPTCNVTRGHDHYEYDESNAPFHRSRSINEPWDELLPILPQATSAWGRPQICSA